MKTFSCGLSLITAAFGSKAFLQWCWKKWAILDFYSDTSAKHQRCI